MLSRIASNLFWLGRYVKRFEVISKFSEAEYMASLNAPQTYRKKIALASILQIGGDGKSLKSWHPSLFDEAVLFHVILDSDNPNSLIRCMATIRENAMSARDILPLDVWESINKMYHKVSSTSGKALKTQGAFTLLEENMLNALFVQTLFDMSMLRNETWQFMRLGIALENAIQSCRIIKIKLIESEKLDASLKKSAVENYMWTSLLKSLGTQGLHKSGKGSENLKKSVLETAILDKIFPQSILFNLNMILELAQKIEENRLKKEDSVIRIAGRLYGKYAFTSIEELLEDGAEKNLDFILEKLYSIGESIDKRYFGI